MSAPTVLNIAAVPSPVRTSTCPHLTASGRPCHGKPLESGLCAFHDPERKVAMQAGRRRGGKARANVRRLARRPELGELRDYLLGVLDRIEAGELSASQGRAISELAGRLIAIHELDELEARLRALEEARDE